MRKTATTLTTTAVLLPALLLAGCGSSTSSSGSSSGNGSGTGSTASASASPGHGVVIDVTVHDKKVTPNGERVTAKVGQPVTIHVTSNRAGELHVHSTPEQELKYAAGKTTMKVTIDKPGIVDIEDHLADVVIVQLEVS